ncbi:MAG: hypothetical protein QFX33_02850 [Candidatus Nezhaarchaeota archaeon]|nr:hypothetical protein [Candidatus Nezhaarchaeota archaeon]
MVNFVAVIPVKGLIWCAQGETGLDMLMQYLLIMLLLLFVVSMFLSLTRRRAEAFAKAVRTVTVLRCENCDYKEEREFQVGDYVFKRIGECIKCKGGLYISMIYGVPEKPS